MPAVEPVPMRKKLTSPAAAVVATSPRRRPAESATALAAARVVRHAPVKRTIRPPRRVFAVMPISLGGPMMAPWRRFDRGSFPDIARVCRLCQGARLKPLTLVFSFPQTLGAPIRAP